MLAQIHAAAAFFMTGIIWYVQLVHYPLFRRLRADPGYFQENIARTALLVIPAMTVEAVAAGLLCRGGAGLALLGAALLAGIWASSLLFQFPRHRELSRGYSDKVLNSLLLGNWMRVALWTARSVIALLLLGAP